ncbi:MAG: TolC family protein [Vitreoscilla sp.]
MLQIMTHSLRWRPPAAPLPAANAAPFRSRTPMARSALIAVGSLLLAGCATFSEDGGMSRVSELTRQRAGHPIAYQGDDRGMAAARTRSAELLAAPLSAEAAVELALLNNRGLQAQLGDLGLSEADLVQAGRVRNPVLSLGRLAGGGALEIDRSIMFDVLGLLTLPARSQVARQHFEQAQYQAAANAVIAATEAREAFIEAVAARTLALYAQQVKETADASDELARGMLQAGNLSKLDQMREQAFRADADAESSRAGHRASAARERLVRALGLGEQQSSLQLPDRLPEIPKQPEELGNAEQAALDQRLDVLMARHETEAMARQLGLAKATGFINVVDAGWQDKRERGSPSERGAELQFEVPLFDFGGVARARAKTQYFQSVDRMAAVVVNARSQVREAHAGYRTAHDLARHYRDEVVPLHKRISDENLLRYNGMLIDVFELLADAREQIAGVTACVQAQRDFWLADSRLHSALAGAIPAASGASTSSH